MNMVCLSYIFNNLWGVRMFTRGRRKFFYSIFIWKFFYFIWKFFHFIWKFFYFIWNSFILFGNSFILIFLQIFFYYVILLFILLLLLWFFCFFMDCIYNPYTWKKILLFYLEILFGFHAFWFATMGLKTIKGFSFSGQGWWKVWKLGGGASSILVGMICPPPRVR